MTNLEGLKKRIKWRYEVVRKNNGKLKGRGLSS